MMSKDIYGFLFTICVHGFESSLCRFARRRQPYIPVMIMVY